MKKIFGVVQTLASSTDHYQIVQLLSSQIPDKQFDEFILFSSLPPYDWWCNLKPAIPDPSGRDKRRMCQAVTATPE